MNKQRSKSLSMEGTLCDCGGLFEGSAFNKEATKNVVICSKCKKKTNKYRIGLM